MTEVFDNLARTAARARGHATLQVVVLPHPMETRSPAEIVEIARARFDELVSGLLVSPPSG